METWVCAGFLLISNGEMGACWVGVGQQLINERAGWLLNSNAFMLGVCYATMQDALAL